MHSLAKLLVPLLMLWPIASKAYVIPAFPVHQAFPLPSHPTPVTIEEASINITATPDNEVEVSALLVLLSKFNTTITLQMGATEIRQLNMDVDGEPLLIQESAACKTLGQGNARTSCNYQTNIKLPAGKRVAVTSHYLLKAHAGASASSLYGDTLPPPDKHFSGENTIATIRQNMVTYALTLKGLNRWSSQPKHLQIALSGKNILKNMRDLSPAGWTGNKELLVWRWDSNLAPLPAIDIAWQTVNNVLPMAEENIYKKLPTSIISNEQRHLHLLTLKRFNSVKEVYFDFVEKALRQQSGKTAIGSSGPQNTTATNMFLIPEAIAAYLQLNDVAATKQFAKKYVAQIEEMQTDLLLDGQDLTSSTEAINLITQLASDHPDLPNVN